MSILLLSREQDPPLLNTTDSWQVQWLEELPSLLAGGILTENCTTRSPLGPVNEIPMEKKLCDREDFVETGGGILMEKKG